MTAGRNLRRAERHRTVERVPPCRCSCPFLGQGHRDGPSSCQIKSKLSQLVCTNFGQYPRSADRVAPGPPRESQASYNFRESRQDPKQTPKTRVGAFDATTKTALPWLRRIPNPKEVSRSVQTK